MVLIVFPEELPSYACDSDNNAYMRPHLSLSIDARNICDSEKVKALLASATLPHGSYSNDYNNFYHRPEKMLIQFEYQFKKIDSVRHFSPLEITLHLFYTGFLVDITGSQIKLLNGTARNKVDN
jgi:hypothetical protein